MIAVDFHAHSHFSMCGTHSVLEMLTRARDLGMQGMAITDHGLNLHGRLPSTFFDRLFDPVPGIRLLKGVECNLTEKEGEIDFPHRFMPWVDLILLGIHPNTPVGQGVAEYTRLLESAIVNNPYLDIITHPNDETYLVDFEKIASLCAKRNLVIELNNSKDMLGRVAHKTTLDLVAACKKCSCRMAITSDAHTINEVGVDDHAQAIIAKMEFPAELLVNDTAEKAFAFVEERKMGKVFSGEWGSD